MIVPHTSAPAVVKAFSFVFKKLYGVMPTAVASSY